MRASLLGFYGIAQVFGPVQVCLNEPVDDSSDTTTSRTTSFSAFCVN